ncbi:MAG: radical SAM family heme chaperone HemW [Armatimonadota bacterium]
MDPSPGLYVHIPFCIAKCAYCDFVSFPKNGQDTRAYVRALVKEMQLVRAQVQVRSEPFGSVYFGGGTPTVLSADVLVEVLRVLRETYPVAGDAEVAVEANPGTVDLPSLQRLREGGFNRLSLGVQALDNRLLKLLGRVHTAEQAVESVLWARRAGFGNVSIDLIYGLPSQSLDDWRATLEETAALAPEHISVYALSVEPGTRFWHLREEGLLCLPDEDEEAEMGLLAERMLAEGGYERYEISNYARRGYRCRHNQACWRNGAYLGFGAGAASYWDGERRRNVSDPGAYVRTVMGGEVPVEESERLPPEKAVGEAVMLGLRMLEGVDVADLERRFGVSVLDRFASEVFRLTGLGLLDVDGNRMRLTARGLMLANEVWAEFVG